MDPEPAPPQIGSLRHKCSACYKQYKKKEHLIEHMKVSYHSVHQPKCGVCRKHCKSLESLREHITGPLPKANCAKVFAARGCDLCLNIFDSPEAVTAHKEVCRLSAPAPLENVSVFISSHLNIDGLNYENKNEFLKLNEREIFSLGPIRMTPMELEVESTRLADASNTSKVPEVIAIDCEMVGGGSDESLDICARVCLIDEDENVVLHTYVKPQIPITNYRYEITGITEMLLLDAMPLKQVQEKILEILYNGESIWRTRLEGGKARLLVGHDLAHDLDCLRMCYPEHLLRDTAQYRPLMKTNLISHSLKYLTKTYLGYEIQSGIHDPYEDCVAAMRLYKRMRDQVHRSEGITSSDATQYTNSCINNFDSWRSKELEKMSPDALYEISRSKYRCWCFG